MRLEDGDESQRSECILNIYTFNFAHLTFLLQMHKYFIKTPWIAKKIFSSYVWSLPVENNAVYLTFDDGPHPTITPWVLEQLRQFDAKAVFFCIGDNVEKYPEIFQKILDDGHAIGNHTHHHLNGWKTNDEQYMEDVAQAAQIIKSNLFRPPYGRIKTSQAKKLVQLYKRTMNK
jgi:peptidoglycan-N-acetylglucosamine deacetylase